MTVGRWSQWLYALAVACAFIFINGYAFNTGDQAEHLPQVYQTLDPELYKGDYFVPATQAQFTVRHYYERLALILARTVGLEWGAFLLTLLCITVMAWAFQRIAWEFFGSRWAMWLAPILVLLVFYRFTVGGNLIMYNLLISSTLSKALASVALLRSVKRNWGMAGALLGIASLFQVLVGLQLMLILTVAVPSVMRDRRFVSTTALWTAYLIPALFVLVPTLRQQFGPQGEFDADLYYEILYRFRNYHHYLPSLFPVTHFIKFSGLIGLGILSYFLIRPNDRRFFPALIGAVLFGMMVYTVGLEVLEIQALGKLQWFKTSIWAGAFSALMIAGLLGMILQSIFPVGDMTLARVGISSAALSIVLLVLMTNSMLLPGFFQGRFVVGNRNLTDLERMHVWIAENTPKDAMILAPPEDNGFSCQAKRPMPIHFLAIIHEPGFMLPWYRKIREVYGTGLEDIGERNAREIASERYSTVNYRGAAFPIAYRLDNLHECRFVSELGPVVHREGDWVLSVFVPNGLLHKEYVH